MKIIKYPKWKKIVECPVCTTKYVISSKDVAKRKVKTANWPKDNHKAFSYCPFCHEQNETSIQEFYNEDN